MNIENSCNLSLEALKAHSGLDHYKVFRGQLSKIFGKAVVLRGQSLMRRVPDDTPRSVTNKHLVKFIQSYLDHIELLLHKERVRFYHFGKKKAFRQMYIDELTQLRFVIEHVKAVYTPGETNE